MGRSHYLVIAETVQLDDIEMLSAYKGAITLCEIITSLATLTGQGFSAYVEMSG